MTKTVKLIIIGLALGLVILSYAFWHSSAAYTRCSDYRTQREAQNAYSRGATNLDGYDKDGLACESLPYY